MKVEVNEYKVTLDDGAWLFITRRIAERWLIYDDTFDSVLNEDYKWEAARRGQDYAKNTYNLDDAFDRVAKYQESRS